MQAPFKIFLLTPFHLTQLDLAGLGHNVFTAEALALLVRSGEGLLRRTRNLCLAALIQAVRDQVRTVDLKQVNRVLIQPHWRRDADKPVALLVPSARIVNHTSPAPRWSREQIRAARHARLLPLLRKRGLELIERDAGNFECSAHPGLLLKDSFWRWPERDLAGNAIDFLVQVLGLTFHDAMREITTTPHPTEPTQTPAAS